MNAYDSAGLRTLTSRDFFIIRNYSMGLTPKKLFIETYIPFSREVHGKFIPLDSAYTSAGLKMTVRDESDFYHYLGIPFPEWNVRITTNKQGLINNMFVDSTKGTAAALTLMREKSRLFSDWLKSAYPEYEEEELFQTAGLLLRLLKEYAKME